MYFVIFLLLLYVSVIFVVFFADRDKTTLQTQQKLSAKVSSNGYAEAICLFVYISCLKFRTEWCAYYLFINES